MGKFPDYNDDGVVTFKDLSLAPAERKEELVQMILSDDYGSFVPGGTATQTSDWKAVSGEKERSGELMQLGGLSTTNPMGSMPSISNVGAAPFSGSINWNAIPGGFQPLPQVAGGKKKLYQLSKFHGGVNQKSSPRDISDSECQEAKNVTVSQVGRIKLLGDIKSTSSGITTATLAEGGGYNMPLSGYGLYVFKSGYSLASPPVQGDYTIAATTDGEYVELADGTTEKSDYLAISNTGYWVAPIFYAAGNGLYACDANFLHTATRKVAMLVYRKDYNGTILTKEWADGEALLTSPTFIESGDSDGATGNTDEAATGKITLEWDDAAAGADVVFDSVTVNGSAAVHIGSDEDVVGNWDGNYFFYISWLFDNGCETGLTALQKTGGDFASGYPFSDEALQFNFSVKNVDLTEGVSSTAYFGGDARIHGARIYFRESRTVERYLLAEVSLQDGIKGSLDSTFTPWYHSSNVYYLEVNTTFKSPPSIDTYVSKNGYYANEMYGKSSATIENNTAGPAPHEVRYRTATVGSNGSVFIGCYMFRGKLFADGMMYSMPNKPGVFPEYNVFDSPSSDGTPITALVAFKDKILQFKQDAMYVVNISSPSLFYTEQTFRNCGVMNPCQTFQTPFGVIFANYIGCFVYDGNKVISLTSGKFTIDDWGISEGGIIDTAGMDKDDVSVPCVGYDPRSQSIIVLKDIGDNSTDTSAWVYSMVTQSWTEGTSMITNTVADRHTNFIISPNGYLSIQQDASEALKTYNIGEASTQEITYQTKDLDFGMPSQTKKIFKVYITYKGDCDSVDVYYRTDGNTTNRQFNSDNTPLTNAGTTTTVATLTPTTSTQATGIYSFSLLFINTSGTVGNDFEINDISILYRPRPIK